MSSSPLENETQALRSALDHQTRLSNFLQRIYGADELFDIIEDVQRSICDLLHCERVTIYQRSRTDRDIVSKFATGGVTQEIRVPLSASSVAGYVAMSRRTVLLKDAYDEAELRRVHSELRFNQSWDKKIGFRTRSVLTVAVTHKDVLLGVLQLLNKSLGRPFTEDDQKHAEEIASLLGQKFRYEFGGTSSPFEWLVHTKRIRQEQLDALMQRARTENSTVHELLLRDGGVSKAELGSSLERFYQVPFVMYDPHHQIPSDLLLGINREYLQNQLWAPLSGERGEEVIIAIDDPNDARRIMEIQQSLPAKKYVFQVALREDILRFLGEGSETAEDSGNLQELVGKLQDKAEIVDTGEAVEENDATVVQLVNRLIGEAFAARASDIHIEPGKEKANATVRLRVDGACRPSLAIPATHVQAVVSRIKIMASLDISERRKPQDGKCVVRFRGQPIELRVATLPTVNGESVVLRILSASEPLPLEKLNLSPQNITGLKQISASPHGIILVVGPTGSGKTTTLHSVLRMLNTPDVKIWTAEDPVEITQPGLNQLQVKPQIGVTFASALRAFLRADPDIIMIGEMRDEETARAGVEASLTGHLVLSTLHTNSAPETVVRLLDLGLDPVSFSDALQGILAQRLVRTLCAKCKISSPLTATEYELLRRLYGEQYFSELNIEEGKTLLSRTSGCPDCGNSGYRGRTGIHELLVSSQTLKNLIYRNASAAEIKEAALKEGMRTLMQDGIRKVLLGQTDLEEIRKAAAA